MRSGDSVAIRLATPSPGSTESRELGFCCCGATFAAPPAPEAADVSVAWAVGGLAVTVEPAAVDVVVETAVDEVDDETVVVVVPPAKTVVVAVWAVAEEEVVAAAFPAEGWVVAVNEAVTELVTVADVAVLVEGV